MGHLPASRQKAAKHAGMIFLIGGLEQVTRALRMGDGFEDTDGLAELSRRARALHEAIEDRMREAQQ